MDVPREDAFDYVADLANRPSFTEHFVSDFHLSRLESTGLGAGARFRYFVPPQALWMDTVITGLEPPHRISERGRGGRDNRLASATEWEFVLGPGPLTTVRVAYWTEPIKRADRAKELLGGASIWYRRDWQAALRRLRDRLEAGGPGSERVGVAGGNRYLTGVP